MSDLTGERPGARSPIRPRILLFNLVTDASDPVLGFTTRWINGLAQRAEYLDVITMERGELAVSDNVKVFSVGKELGYNEIRRTWVFYRSLASLLSDKTYDICIAHMMPLFAAMGSPLLKLRGIPTILWYQHKATPTVLRIAEKLVDRVISGSIDSFRIPSEKLVVTGHAIDTSLFVPTEPSEGNFVISTVGRIAPVKNLDVLIDAAAILKQRRTVRNLEVRIVGSAYDKDLPYQARLYEQVHDLDLSDVVTFVGPVRWEDTVVEYQKARVTVNLSDTSSLDKAGLESMSCGVPLITSNIAFKRILADAAPELVIEEGTGEEIASACELLARTGPSEHALLARKMREIVEEGHSFDRLMDRLTDGSLLVSAISE